MNTNSRSWRSSCCAEPAPRSGGRVLAALCALLLASGVACAQQAISFPTSDGGLIHADVYGAGARTIDVIGASMGGSAAADAVIASPAGLVRRLVLLGAAPDGPAGQLKCPTLFIVARDDASGDGPRLPGIRAKFAQTPQPKRLVVVAGSAHAQFLFKTDQGARVLKEIMDFLQAG